MNRQATACTLLITLICYAAEGICDDSSIHLDIVSPVSQQFLDAIRKSGQELPPHLYRALQENGWSIKVARLLTDAVPSLRHDNPRGWPPGTTWDNVEAVCYPLQKIVVVAEWRRKQDGRLIKSDRFVGVFRHELAHAYDYAAKQLEQLNSNSPAYQRAYQVDVGQMDQEAAKRLSYYQQRGAAGRQEAFAEALALLSGGGSDSQNATGFRKSFPNVLQLVRDSYSPADRKTSPQLAFASRAAKQARKNRKGRQY